MKLLLRRDQRAGGMLGGKVIFVLNVRADISPSERAAMDKYKLADCILYQRDNTRPDLDTYAGIAKAFVRHALNLTVKARDLADGKVIECKDILEMLAVEEQLKEAGNNFVMMLRAAMHFGGEEVVEL